MPFILFIYDTFSLEECLSCASNLCENTSFLTYFCNDVVQATVIV